MEHYGSNNIHRRPAASEEEAQRVKHYIFKIFGIRDAQHLNDYPKH